jgi:hypothetical protein
MPRSVRVSIGETATVRTGDILAHPIDVEAYAAGLPEEACTKGYFINQLAESVRESRPEAYPEFIARYPDRLPLFRNVPMRDSLRRGVDAACLSHPDVPVAEALRRMGWLGYRSFLGSLFGKVVFIAMGRDLESIYRFGPRAHAHSEKNGTQAVYSRLGDRHFRYDYDPCFTWLDCYEIGIIEGAAMMCGYSTQIQVHLVERYRGWLECEWF